MFLAGKVEETPRPLKDVILVSYEIIHKKDQTAAQRIKQKVFSILHVYLESLIDSCILSCCESSPLHALNSFWFSLLLS